MSKNETDIHELPLTPCTFMGPHKPHVWSWSNNIVRSDDIDYKVTNFRFVDDNRLCPGVERIKSEDEKWAAAKRSMIILSWFMAFLFAAMGLVTIFFGFVVGLF